MAVYNYSELRPTLFTERGVRDILKTRDHIRECLKKSGAVTMGEAMSATSGDSWTSMAYVDFLVEVGDIVEVQQAGEVVGQHRIFR
jgi:hypothetical protein